MERTVIQHDGINYVIGDLLQALEEGHVSLVAHQTNCRGIMGSGIAKAIAVKYPQVKQYDRILCDTNDVEGVSGYCGILEVDDGKFIANLYGQVDPGPNTDYDLLETALWNLESDCHYYDIDVIGFPLIGCGIGGGSWGIVSKILRNTMSSKEFYVYVLDEETFNRVVMEENQ